MRIEGSFIVRVGATRKGGLRYDFWPADQGDPIPGYPAKEANIPRLEPGVYTLRMDATLGGVTQGRPFLLIHDLAVMD